MSLDATWYKPKPMGLLGCFEKMRARAGSSYVLSSSGQSTSQLHQPFDSKAKNSVVHKTITLRVWSWCRVAV